MSDECVASQVKEKWIRTSNGWKTCKTIVIINNKAERVRSEWREENVHTPAAKGFVWRTNCPLVILPGYYARGPVFYFVSVTNDSPDSEPSKITDALQALDIQSTLKDSRKFGYVCKLLGLFLKNKTLNVDSFVTEHTFSSLQTVVEQVLSREENVHVARHLMKLAKKHLSEKKDSYTEFPDECSERKQLINELQHKLRKFKVKKGHRVSLKAPKLEELPDECLRLILGRFIHHTDICRMSQVNRHFNKLCNENLLWKNLCQFHFSETQLLKQTVNIKNDWLKIYRTLVRKYPMRELFADMLELCSHCHYLFWKFSSHICSYDIKNCDHKPPVYIAITPKGFLHLFDG